MLKNYKIIQKIDNLDDFMFCLYNRESIYFVPAGKVMPTKFFMGWSWMMFGAAMKHLENGSFVEVVKKSDFAKFRISKAIINAKNQLYEKETLPDLRNCEPYSFNNSSLPVL